MLSISSHRFCLTKSTHPEKCIQTEGDRLMKKIENPKIDFFNSRKFALLLILVLLILFSVTYYKMAFLDYVPNAGDTSQWRNSAQSQIEYEKENGKPALWNGNIFSGMPGYLIHFKKVVPFLDNIREFTNVVINWRVFLMFLSALGMYILLLSMKFEPLIALIAAISFGFSCHFLGLIDIGHNTKFRSIVYIPWIFWALQMLLHKKNFIALGLLSIFLIGQLRENHPQIAYYTYLMIGMYWAFQLVWAIKEKKLSSFAVFSGLLLLSFVLTVLAVAQPYLSVKEYGEYSIRGGADGVGKSYATSWSFHPLEILTFLIPDFFGGISPYYWGWMPFTQTFMYMGIVILFFAVFALVTVKKKIVIYLGWLCLITLFMSFGKHFEPLSDFLLNYLPGYNKFRVPATILVIIQFASVVLAAFGLKSAIILTQNKDFQPKMKKVFYAVVILLVLFTLFHSSFQNLPLSKDNESSRYSNTQFNQLRQIRLDRLVSGGYRSLGMLVLIVGLLLLLSYRKINKTVLLVILAILTYLDLRIVNKNYFQNLTLQSSIDKDFHKTRMDQFLLNDDDLFRIYPLGGDFGQNKWGYYHETIGGYHGAKLQRYQDIIENCLNEEISYRIPINWNIVDMLNVKYIIFDQKIPIERLEYAFHDKKIGKTALLNKKALPRAWFVDEITQKNKKEDIWAMLNSPSFDPSKTAIVEEETGEIQIPKNDSIQILLHEPDVMKMIVKNDSTSFLMISEVFYPEGWNAYLDGKKSKIFSANYILRGLRVPAGNHELVLKFEPKSYQLGVSLSYIGIILSLFITILGVTFWWKKRKNE